MTIAWRERAFTSEEAADAIGIRRNTLDVWVHRHGGDRFSERRKGGRYFSTADIAALAAARRMNTAGVPLREAIAAVGECFFARPWTESAILVGDGRIAAVSFDIAKAARLAVEESLTVIPVGRIADEAVEFCNKTK